MMAKSVFNTSSCLAGLIACVSVEGALAGSRLNAKTNFDNKLYHERTGSQIEEFFRKLPSVEKEVDALFDDAEKSEKEVEDLFRRILYSKDGDRNLSFLSENLNSAGVSGPRNRRVPPGATLSNVVPGLSDEENDKLASDFAESETKNVRVAGKSSKNGKSTKTGKNEKGHKSVKKGKRYKDETAKTANRLQKSGKKDKNFGYDPSDGDSDGDDHDEVAEEFNFDTWEWEFVDEESEDQMHKSSSSEMNAGSDPKPMASQNSVGGMMGRMDEISDEGQFTFSSNFLSNMDFQPVGNGEPVNSNFLSNTDFQPVGNGELVSSNFLDFQPVGNGESVSSNFLDFQPVGNGEPVGRPAPMAIMSNKLGKFRFNFPTIQHTVYSGPINLKAHSSIDLSAMDPEIFDVVQSILTPYLQLTIGDPLNAYNLEIDYAPRYDESVGDDVVTLMEVKCTFKVVSDSIESFLNTNHDEARLWIKDFFTGPSGYNVKKLIESLQSNNIPVDDIVFVNEKFDMGNTVSQANSQSFGNTPSSLNKTGENSRRGISGIAMVCVTLSVLFVGILFFMHSTGRLPSKTEIGEFSLNTRDSVKHHSINARDSIRKCMPTSIQLGKKRKGGDDSEGGGRRRRTFSGTFRRFPTGGLQKAAIQKKGAKSEQYIGDSESTSHKLSKFEDYSFSHYGGDYGPSTPSRQSSIPPMTPMSRRSVDEFGMPDTYDSLHDKSRSDRESLLGRVGKTASYLMSPKQKSNYSTKSPVPSRASRRVTAADIASPDDVDNWSIDSYESSEKSSASDDLLYRGWNESGPEMRRPIPSDPPASRREKLSLPFFK